MPLCGWKIIFSLGKFVQTGLLSKYGLFLNALGPYFLLTLLKRRIKIFYHGPPRPLKDSDPG